MQAFVSQVVTLVLAIALPLVSAASRPGPETGAEQRVYEYEILREGAPVGSHRILMERHGDVTRVVSRSLIEIGLLGFTLYRFAYESEEDWDAQGLRRLLVRVDDDGERLDLDGRREGDRFHWSINDEVSETHEMPVFPTNHWNSAVLAQERVLNTLTGRVNRVSIQPHEAETQVIEDATAEVKRFRYSGELRLDAWYDIGGRWLGMRFEGRDGSTIEYRCRDCRASRSL